MTYRFQKPRRTHTEDVDESLGLQQQQVGRNLNALIRKKSSEWKVLDEAANCFISASGLNFQLNLSTVDVVRLEMCQALSVRNLESIEFASFIREDISIFNYISWADKKKRESNCMTMSNNCPNDFPPFRQASTEYFTPSLFNSRELFPPNSNRRRPLLAQIPLIYKLSPNLSCGSRAWKAVRSRQIASILPILGIKFL